MNEEKKRFVSVFSWIFLDCSDTMISRKMWRRFCELDIKERKIFLLAAEQAALPLAKNGKPRLK